MSRRGRNKLTPSFFPFISVLIAIIGTLIFLTLTMTLTALDPVLVIQAPMEWVLSEDGVEGHTRQRKNVMIECVDDRAVLLSTEGGEVVELMEFDGDTEWNNLAGFYGRLQKGDPDSWQGTPFLDFVNEMAKKRSTHFINFLLRPSGIHPYTTLSDILKMRNSIEFDEEKYPDAPKKWIADWGLVYVEEIQEVTIK